MESLTHAISVSILKIGGLGKKLLGGDKARAEAKAAAAELQRSIDNNHWLAIDRDDSFEVSSRPMQGLRDVEERCADAVNMDVDLPREILANITAGGLNTGDNAGPIRTYYDTVRNRQKLYYTPGLLRILAVYFAISGISAKRFTIEWCPLWAKSDAEKTADVKARADAAKVYFDMGGFGAETAALLFAASGLMPEAEESPEDGPQPGPEGPGPADSGDVIKPAESAPAPGGGSGN